MSTENNKALVRKLVEAHTRSDVMEAAEILSPRLVWHVAGAPKAMGRDAYLEGIEQGAKGFSDIAANVHDLIAEGDRVASRVTFRMRHTGPFQNIAPTGRAVVLDSSWFYRVEGRQIAEIWQLEEDIFAKLRR